MRRRASEKISPKTGWTINDDSHNCYFVFLYLYCIYILFQMLVYILFSLPPPPKKFIIEPYQIEKCSPTPQPLTSLYVDLHRSSTLSLCSRSHWALKEILANLQGCLEEGLRNAAWNKKALVFQTTQSSSSLVWERMRSNILAPALLNSPCS